MKGTGFFRQSSVLISRYLKIFFNDKQNLALTIGIPLLTIIVVCLVASEDMFALYANNKINDGYPILAWEEVDYEIGNDENEEKEEKESTKKVWDGVIPQQPQLMPADADGKEYYISSPGDLQFIANAKGEWLNKTYYLNNDVDMDGRTITPIGTESEPFKGKFEGNGHIVSNFVVKSENNCVGFFGKIATDNAEITNLGIKDAKIEGSTRSNYVGLVVGKNENGLIENCFSVNSSINVTSDFVGGIAGCISGADEKAVIRNCYSRADIKADGKYLGGIVGSVDEGCLQYTYFAGKLEKLNDSKSTEYIGSIAGRLNNDEKSFKCVYDNELVTAFEAVGSSEGNRDIKDCTIEGWSTDKLQQNASLIRKAEKDAEDEPNGNFKNDGELAGFSGTQTGLFMLACVAIFVGICNSVQEICKERNILKREYMTNLKLSSYMVSKLVVQGMVCAVQMLVVLLIFFASVSDKVYPEKGVILPNSKIEIFVTMFLLTYAADAIALLISSVVKTSSTANTFIPIILIVQIVFSGVLFDLGGFMDKLGNIMISKWGIGALAATCHLNESRVTMVLNNPGMTLQLGDEMSRIKDLYVSTTSNLLSIWVILIAFVVVCALFSGVILTGVKKDKR